MDDDLTDRGAGSGLASSGARRRRPGAPARAGDEAAFAALVRRYHAQLLRLASTFVPSRAVAEEVVQETWLGVVRGIERFEGRASVRTWLFRILVNQARTAGVREHRSMPLDLGDEAAVPPGRFDGAGEWAAPPAPWTDEVDDHLRAGVRVSAVSIMWTALSSTTAIGLGIGAGSLVLVVFGAAGLLDALGSATLVVHFRHAMRHEEFSQRHERLALRLVTGGLAAVGGLTAVESGRRLVNGVHAHAVAGGVALAVGSALVLGLLSLRKRRIAAHIPRRAPLADGWLSATGALLAAVTVAGTGLTAGLGWWWPDPMAAGIVALGALWIAAVMARAKAETRLVGPC